MISPRQIFIRFTKASFVFNIGKTNGMLFFRITFWKSVHLVLSAFRDSVESLADI